MILRLLAGSIARQPKRKLAALGALAVAGTAVATSGSLWLAAGDRLLTELQAYGANLVVTSGTSPLAAPDLGSLGEGFWRNNLQAAAPGVEGVVRSGAREVRILGTRFQGSLLRRGSAASRIPLSYARLHPWTHASPRWPSDAAAQDGAFEAAVSDPTGRMRPGDELSFGATRIRVVAELEGLDETPPRTHAAERPMPLLVVTLAAAGRILRRPGELDWVRLRALTTPEYGLLEATHRDPRLLSPTEFERWSCTPYPSTVAASVGDRWPGAAVSVARAVTEVEGRFLDQARALLGLLAVLGLAGSILAVAAALSHLMRDERPVVALLRTLGATRAALGALYFGQATLLGLVGGAAGAAAFAAAARALADLPLRPAAAPPVFALAFAACIVAAWAGAAGPILAALRAAPAPVLHEQVS